jgi:hypothetical protein
VLIEYKLLGQPSIFQAKNIESEVLLGEIAVKSQELSQDYRVDLSKSSILMQSIKDIFATDIFSDHDDFFYKVIIYSLIIDNLQLMNQDLEAVFINEDSSRIARYLNDSYNFEVLNKKQCLEAQDTKDEFQASKSGNKSNLGTFKRFSHKIRLSLNKRFSLVDSLLSLSYGSQILLHHSDRFDDLVCNLDQLEFGPIEKVNYRPGDLNSKKFSASALTSLCTLMSMLLACLVLPFARQIDSPKLAKRFFSGDNSSISDIFKRMESSIFYVTVFMFFFKRKKISKVFVYSHLDLLSRCFIRCATLGNSDINYIRNNFLYFTTELHCMSYSRFYVRSDQEAAIAQVIGLSGVEVLENTRHYADLPRVNDFSILYIDESNGIDITHPNLRDGIYNDLAKLTNSLKAKITVRPHPTDKINHLNYPSMLQVDGAKQLDNSLKKNAIIIGRNSTLLLKLAHLGKTVIVYDPSYSFWFTNQSKLEFSGDISFISDYVELERQLQIYGAQLKNV